MDEIDKEIVRRYHTSPAAAASEVTMRQAMRRAGFSEAEIDESLLVYYVQRSLFRRWAILAAVTWILLWGVRHCGTTVDSGRRRSRDPAGPVRVG